jgi:hypothetical protein
MSELKTIKCVICKRDIEHKVHDGKVYWTQGNNAQPVADGRCCDRCDVGIVIPTRFNHHFSSAKVRHIMEEE